MVVNAQSPPCPGCGAWITRIVLTKYENEGGHIVRRRHCEFCDIRFYTGQQVERIAEVKWTSGPRRQSIPVITKIHPVTKKPRGA